MPEPTPLQTTELDADAPGERLDVFVARRIPSLTRARVQKLIEEGRVTVAGQRAKASLRLEAGQRVTVDVPPPVDGVAVAEDIALEIIFEDADMLVVNKPPGMTVHRRPVTRRRRS